MSRATSPRVIEELRDRIAHLEGSGGEKGPRAAIRRSRNGRASARWWPSLWGSA